LITKKENGKERTIKEEIFDKSSDQIARIVNKTWLCRYPRCHYLIYNNGSEFKLHFETFWDSYDIKRKPTMIKNPQERVHQVLGTMMRTSEIDMANSVEPADIDTFINNAACWAIHSIYHTVLKASPGAATFGRDMLFDILFVADWKQIGEYRQHQTDRSNKHETAHVSTTITKSVVKYKSVRTVYSAKQSPSGEKIHGLMDHNDSSYKWNYQDSNWKE